MKLLKKYARYIVTFCSFSLLLQSTASIEALTPWERAKQSVGGITRKVGGAFENIGKEIGGAATRAFDFISEKTKQALDTATSKILSFDKAKLFNSIQNKMTSAGNRIRKIVNCMTTGQECSVVDRVMLVGTASFIFVGLLVLAGGSIGTAARSKIVEDAKKSQAQQVKGWGPKAMAQRLSNMFSDGKNKFVSLKDGIIKGQLTSGQRNFLVGLGASIIGATLVLAAVLTGVAIYSAQQEEKQKAEIERQKKQDEQETETPAPTTTTQQPTPTIPGPKVPQIPDAPPLPEQKPKGKFKFLGDLKNLAQEVSDKIVEKVTPMQEYFKKEVVAKGSNALQKAASDIHTVLKEKTTAAKRAIISTVEENKQKLAELAQEKFNKAKEIAQKFVQELKAGGTQFYQDTLEAVLGVKVKLLQPAIDKIKEYSTRAMNAFKPYANLRIKGEIQKLTDEVNELIKKASDIGGRWKEAIKEIASRATWIKSHVRPEWMGGKSSEEINKEANMHYPLARKADDLYNFYPKLVEAINKLSLGGPGVVTEKALKVTSMLLGALNSVNKLSGKIGKNLISTELANALDILKNQIVTLADNIREVSRVKPLLKVFPASTPGALFEVLKGYGWRVGTDLHTKIMDKVNQITTIYYGTVAPALEKLNQAQADLVAKAMNIPATVKQQFINKAKLDPMKITLTAPYQLAIILGAAVSDVKKDVTALAGDASTLLQGIVNIIIATPSMLALINQATGGDFVNPDLMSGLTAISNTLRTMKDNLKNLDIGVQKSFAIVPAAS